jgi:hypothetical protein
MYMKKKNIDWTTIDNQMKNLKFPLTFIYNILKNQSKIEDYHLSLIVRFFLKNQTDISLEYPLFFLFGSLDDSFVITKKMINDFYSSLLKKHLFIQIIFKFKETYMNPNFWEKDLNSQKALLEKLLLIFKAHFDSSFTGFSGVTKFVSQLKFKNNDIIYSHVKNRLIESINIFGTDFFDKNNIKLITSEEFDELTTENKMKFIIYYYIKVEKFLNLIINIYDLLIIYDTKIKQIILPKPIYINFNRIYSDNDSEDIHFMID